MGIPSYFKKLLQNYRSCSSRAPPTDASILCYDFNCLIYRSLQGIKHIPYPTLGSPQEQFDTWEKTLLDEVKRTVEEVWVASGRPRNVFLAVDGVVPMAKIRQQRVRRFKSAWLRKGGEETWDSNAITPGTVFMEKLDTMLEGVCKEHRGWVLSGVKEEGEGEHKIMHWLRQIKKPKGPVIVYGLDADLILLTLLTAEQTGFTLWLVRETQEFEKQATEGYTFLQISELKEKLGLVSEREVINYIMVMAFMGNDFLPHSLSYTLKEDGHALVLKQIEWMRTTGRWLVEREKDRWDLDPELFRTICGRFANGETVQIEKNIASKRKQAKFRGKGMDEQEYLPLLWDVEKCLVDARGSLKESWETEYWKWIHPYPDEKEKVCKEYAKGFAWILEYYTGQGNVPKDWMFPAWVPPLWKDLQSVKDEWLTLSKETKEKPILPQEQLTMVLPLASWGLIRGSYKKVPAVAPQFWPEQMTFFSAGKRWFWECEALVPVLTAERLREILNSEN